MPIWTQPSVREVPEVSLSQWCILETADGSKHFVGIDRGDNAGRVSSAICTFDPMELRGATRSGRLYVLVGRNGWAADAQYVWDRWCELNHIESYTDVTDRLLARTQ
jgi:hypothetical protein